MCGISCKFEHLSHGSTFCYILVMGAFKNDGKHEILLSKNPSTQIGDFSFPYFLSFPVLGLSELHAAESHFISRPIIFRVLNGKNSKIINNKIAFQ